jgi:hypothetical protein
MTGEVHSMPTPPPIGPAEGATVDAAVNTGAASKAQLQEGFFKDSVTGALGNLGISVTEAQNYLRSIGFDENGHPVPPQPTLQENGVPSGGQVGSDVTGNIWFSGNALVNLRLAIQEYQKINQETAREMGLMEASLTALWSEIQQDVAKQTKKSYEQQAQMAMFEVIAGAVSIGMGALSLGVTAGTAGLGAAKGFKGFKNPDGTVSTGARGAASGASHAAFMSEMVTRPLGQIAQGGGQIIDGSGKMVGNENLAVIESKKILLQAMADLIKKASDTLSQESKDALSHNDEIRRLLQQVNEQFARLYGSITAH